MSTSADSVSNTVQEISHQNTQSPEKQEHEMADLVEHISDLNIPNDVYNEVLEEGNKLDLESYSKAVKHSG